MEVFDQGAIDSCTLAFISFMIPSKEETDDRHSLYLKLRDD
jgi:hypothetical protein